MQRRTFISTIGGLALGYAGFEVGKGIGRTLEGTITAFYNVAHDTITELRGVPEARLQRAANDVRDHLHDLENDYKTRQAYWEQLGVIDAQGFQELTDILDKAEAYVKESDFTERLTRLKDRLNQRLLTTGHALEDTKPDILKGFDKWLAGKIYGEEQASDEAVRAYLERLNTLVNVYDVNQDNKIAQAALLTDVDSYFTRAQEKAVTLITTYLNSGTITDPDEKAFFQELTRIAEQDPTGRTLADTLMNTHTYFSAVGAQEHLASFNKQLDTTIHHLTDLQGLLDQGLELKNALREHRTRDLTRLTESAQVLYEQIEAKKKKFEAEDRTIEYDTTPKLTRLKDSLLDHTQILRNALTTTTTALGGIAGFGLTHWLLGKLGMNDTVSRRTFLDMESAYKEEKQRAQDLQQKLHKKDPHAPEKPKDAGW